MYLHDINGNLNSKWNGGIFFDVYGTTVPTKYDGILIENNYLERVDRSGIKLVGSIWANQNLKKQQKHSIKLVSINKRSCSWQSYRKGWW